MSRLGTSLLMVVCAFGLPSLASAQRSFTGAPLTYDFAGYAAAGLVPAPGAGQLSSNEFEVVASGAAGGTCAFGATCNTPPWQRGVSSGGTLVSLAGLYEYTVGASAPTFGVQPGTGFFGGGGNAFVAIALVNNTGATLGSIVTSDTTWGYNFSDRVTTARWFFANNLGGAGGRVAIGAPVATPMFGDVMPVWTSTPFAGTVNVASLNIANGATFYVVVQITSTFGGLSDSIAIDDITISLCGNGVVDASEQCDAGGTNGSTTCGCQTTCQWGASGRLCAPSSGASCDAPDTCDGAGTCVNRFQAAGASCRAAVAFCDVGEVCTGSGPNCPVDAFVAAGTSCRAVAGICDVAEACTGSAAFCPADTFVASGTQCRAQAGICDVAEACTGSMASCPADGFVMGGVACRMPAGICDMPELCTGGGASCPLDAFVPAGMVCNPSTGLCDPAEACTGVSTMCPADMIAAAGTPCRAQADLCDVADMCDGATVGCTDRVAASGTSCRAASGTCDVADQCDGASIVCANNFAPNGTSCADALTCNGMEACFSGSCASGTPISCDDGDLCTTDMCPEPSGACSHTSIAGCCNPGSACSDGNVCTTDACSGPGGTCMHSAISGCCLTNADCADASACTADACDTTAHTCSHTGIAGCCSTAADCSDGNVCTTDACGAGNTCTSTAIAGCCLTAGDCGDGNACTTDTCTTHACGHAAITGCCTTAAQCNDSNACTTDTCSATNACSNIVIPGCGDAGPPDAGNDAGHDVGVMTPDMGVARDAGRDTGLGGDSSLGADASRADTGTSPATSSGGCCSVAAGTGNENGAPLLAVGLGLAVLARRRRRR